MAILSFQYQNNQDIWHNAECGPLMKIDFFSEKKKNRIWKKSQPIAAAFFFQDTFSFCINSNERVAFAVSLEWVSTHPLLE